MVDERAVMACSRTVIPAKAGTYPWVPAFAGMTVLLLA